MVHDPNLLRDLLKEPEVVRNNDNSSVILLNRCNNKTNSSVTKGNMLDIMIACHYFCDERKAVEHQNQLLTDS